MGKDVGFLELLGEVCIMVAKLVWGAVKVLFFFISIVIFRSNK